MIRTYLDWLIAVPWCEALRGAARPRRTRARCSTPTTPASRTSRTASPSTSRCASCARSAASTRRARARGRDPDPDRPSRHRQDLDRRVDRPRDRARVRAHVAGRRPRRGRDPRPPPHLHRRAAGPAGPRPARRRDDEPGDHARRGRQGRRRLARRPLARRCSRCSTRRRTTRSATTTSTSSSTSPRSLFIATANVAETIPAPLLDRMEVVRFDGYTTDEKVAIARGYLWPRQLERNGLREDEVEIADEVAADDRHRVHARGRRAQPRARARQAAAQDGDRDRRRARPRRRSRSTSTRVRDALGRQRFFQESAERTAVPGVATGLSVTGAGGDVLFIEATVDAAARTGFVLTGQLGDVMKESARIALSYVRGHADELGIDADALRRPRVPRPRAGGRDPQGRPERRASR